MNDCSDEESLDGLSDDDDVEIDGNEDEDDTGPPSVEEVQQEELEEGLTSESLKEEEEDSLSILKKPQWELNSIKYLPYSEALKEESKLKLIEIKENLGRAVLLRELKPGCLYWTKQLSTYVSLYGLKFSKSDHLAFIHLLYDLVTIEDLDFFLVRHFSNCLRSLLKRKYLLSRSELVLDWKPLYKVYRRVCHSSWKQIQIIRIPNGAKYSIIALIRAACIYFPVESTAEMLAEWKPWLCPFVRKHTKMAMNCFDVFLPILVHPEEQELSFRLWFDDFIQIWLSSQPNAIWELNMMSLFSRLANENIGYVDWNPFMPAIFTRVMRNLQLPTTMKLQIPNPKSGYSLKSMAIFLVSMLGGNSKCQEHLTQLFKTLQSFYHPSNSGPWNLRLQNLLSDLSGAMILRLTRERKRTLETWLPKIPQDSHLTESDITSFVSCLMPCILLSMFSKSGSRAAAVALRNLAALRPELVIPSVIERFYPAVESQIEPHRLLAVMQCLLYVSGPLVRGGENFAEGRSQIFNILNCCLPAIDRNDVNKSSNAFQLILSLVGQIPLIDCSNMVADYPDISEADKDLCLATCQFEDFVLQFLDRCFVIVENSALESYLVTERAYEMVNREEEQLLRGMTSTFLVIILQSSPEICQVAVEKLYNFLKGRIMSVKDAGYMAAKLVRATVQKGDYSFRLFLPSIVKVIDEDVDDECDYSNPGNEILFNLLLLQELVCCDGRILLSHKDILLAVLKKVIKFTDKTGHGIVCTILENLLTRLTTIYYSEYGVSIEKNESDNAHLPIKDWGKTVSLKTLKVPWHMGSSAESEFAQTVVDTFLMSEMSKLTDLCDGRISLTRDQLQQSVAVICSVLRGCLSVCPIWDSHQLARENSVVSMEPLHPTIGYDQSCMLTIDGGKNIRLEVVTFIRRLTQFLLEKHEDNTQAFRNVIKIYFLLLFHFGADYESCEQDLKEPLKGLKLTENPFKGYSKQLRIVFIKDVYSRHLERAYKHGFERFSEIHVSIMEDILLLCQSRYRSVRLSAQTVLQCCFKALLNSHRHLVPQLSLLVENASNCEHHKLKGLLHLLLGKQVHYCLLTQTDLRSYSVLWPVVINTISDKPSINVLLNNLVDSVEKQLYTITIVESMPQSTLETARSLWVSISEGMPSSTPPSEEEISVASSCLSERNEARLCQYQQLIGGLVELLEKPNLHWQSFLFGIKLLSTLIRHDTAFPSKAVQLMLQVLQDVSPAAHKVASNAIMLILEQLKSRIPHVEVDPQDVAGLNNCNLYYDANTVPATKEEWDVTFFVDKPHIGFYKWPQRLQLHEPSGRQVNRWKHRSDMSESETAIYDFFSSSSNVDSIVQFLSVEGNKDHDKLDFKRCRFFKHLFRNYGEEFLPLFKPHLERMVVARENSNKRCALEIICGLVVGSKQWSFEMLARLWTYLVPVVKLAMSRVNVEIRNDWLRGISCMMSHRDPRRMKWLIDIITEDLLDTSQSSFHQATRLQMLVVVLEKQPWRLSGLLCQVMDTVKPHLAHPYEDIREGLSRVLYRLFVCSFELHPFPKELHGPVQSAFLEDIHLKLNTFQNIFEAVSSSTTIGSDNQVEKGLDDDPEWKSSVALLNTVCHWLRKRGLTVALQWTSDFYRLLPILCQGSTCDREPELQVNCRTSIALMARASLSPDTISIAVNAIEAVSNSSSWRCRRTSIEWLQVLIFSNLFVVLQLHDCMEKVRNIVLRLLQDVRPEVQRIAALALSGLFHSEILKFDQTLLDIFMDLSKTPVKKNKGNSMVDMVEGAVQLRHAGILGLCSFVGAYPYDVVDWMPEVLVKLGDHLHDPQPLQSTVRIALSNFWRTHRDTWHEHKLSFTEDQLAVLTDLLISPNYYA